MAKHKVKSTIGVTDSNEFMISVLLPIEMLGKSGRKQVILPTNFADKDGKDIFFSLKMITKARK